MRGLVLAAGLGTRLRPLTDLIPKVLVPVCGTPILGRTLGLFCSQGFGPIALNTHHLHEHIVKYSQGCHHEFTIFHEAGSIRGTGGALWYAREFLGRDSDFFVSNAEPIKQLELKPLVDEFRRSGCACGLVCVPVQTGGTLFSERESGDYLGTRADPIEPTALQSCFIGIAFYRRIVFECMNNDDFSVVPVWRRLQQRGMKVKVLMAPAQTYWRDVGTPAELARVHFETARGESPIELPPGMVRDDEGRGTVRPAGIPEQRARALVRDVWFEEAAVPEGSTFERAVVLAGARVSCGTSYRNVILTPQGELPIG